MKLHPRLQRSVGTGPATVALELLSYTGETLHNKLISWSSGKACSWRKHFQKTGTTREIFS